MMTPSEYAAKIEDMRSQFREWRMNHPEVEVLLKANKPKGVFIACSLARAIYHKVFITCENGMQMLREFGWLDDSPNSPSFMMTLLALDMLDEEDD